MERISVVIPSRRSVVQTLRSVEEIEDYVAEVNVVKEGTTGEAMNLGARRSKTGILLFLDDDVEFTREFFLRALHELEETARSLVGLKTSDGMSCMFMLIRKKDFEDAGGIRLPNYYLDTEFGFRAEKLGIRRILHPVSCVKHLSPTSAGFWSRRQRLLWFHSCYVRLRYPELYTENYGKWRNVKLRHFVFRRHENLLKMLYMDTILLAGAVYYGFLQQGLTVLSLLRPRGTSRVNGRFHHVRILGKTELVSGGVNRQRASFPCENDTCPRQPTTQHFEGPFDTDGSLTGLSVIRMLCRAAFVILRVSLRLIAGKIRRDMLFEKKGWTHRNPFSLSIERMLPPHLGRLMRMSSQLKTLSYEREVSATLKEITGRFFLDIGANAGYYSILLKNNFDEIFAFEPLPRNFSKLCWYLQRFKARNVVPKMIAISDHDGEEILALNANSLDPFEPPCAFQLSQLGDFLESAARIRVKTRSLSSLFPGSFPKVSEIDCVKMDVEGGEWKVLKGAEAILTKVQRWMIELHDLKRKEEIEEWFASHGYSFEWLDEGEKTGHIYAWRENG